MRSASARGVLPAALASTMAALVARSPCEASLGGSSVMPSMLASCGTTPSCLSCWTAARTCPWNPAKTSMNAPRKDASARLTQIGGGVKQAPMLGERVAVGHAGDEIGRCGGHKGACRAQAPARAIQAAAPRDRRCSGSKRSAHDARGIAHDAVDARMRGRRARRERREARRARAAWRREGDDGDAWHAARRRRFAERARQAAVRLGADVVDHGGDQAPVRLVEQPRAVDAGMNAAHLLQSACRRSAPRRARQR